MDEDWRKKEDCICMQCDYNGRCGLVRCESFVNRIGGNCNNPDCPEYLPVSRAFEAPPTCVRAVKDK